MQISDALDVPAVVFRKLPNVDKEPNLKFFVGRQHMPLKFY